MIILYLGGNQSFLLRSFWTWVFKSAEQPNPSTRWKGELHCRPGQLLRTQPWLEPRCQPEKEEMIAKLYTNAMRCNAQPWKVSLHQPRLEEAGTSPAKEKRIEGLANDLQSNWCFYQSRPNNLYYRPYSNTINQIWKKSTNLASLYLLPGESLSLVSVTGCKGNLLLLLHGWPRHQEA